MTLNYSNRIVAFIDILGFQGLISSLNSNPRLHQNIHRALSHIKSYKISAVSDSTAERELEISVFSDCIAISSEPEDFHDVIWASGWLQARLLGLGILTRGGIALGKTFHSNDIRYGQGMVDAYRIESSAAIYPRIVLDPAVVDKTPIEYRNVFLEKDADGLWFIDAFSFNVGIDGGEFLAADGSDPHEALLDELGRHIKDGIANAKQVDHLSKWTWLSHRHVLAYEHYIKTRKTKLDHMLDDAF